jgi:formylglycine-generating enzyme required for sulfatase activity
MFLAPGVVLLLGALLFVDGASSASRAARIGGAIDAGRPVPRLDGFWSGLGPPSERGSTSEGIVVLRPPLGGLVWIHGGRFVMGSTPREMRDALTLCEAEPLGPACRHASDRLWDVAVAIRAEGHAHEVTLSDFFLDRLEVTIAEYNRCVAASSCTPAAFPPGDPRYDEPTFPVTHVTWQDAATFCAWRGARLPTEAEWERAARGPKGFTFPWGNLYNPRLSNHGSFADDPTDAQDGFAGLAPVGSFPDGVTTTGIFDLAGNAAEWVADWYERDEQSFGYSRGAKVNPTGPAFSALGHVVRGGSYRDGAHWMRTAARRGSNEAQRDIGFRCARSTSVR